MLALIDGDIVVYRTGFASQKIEAGLAIWRANETLEQILAATGATEYRVYLSDSTENNYRYKIFPGYKASRQKTAKPVHYQALKDHLIREWGATITLGQEADDALGIEQTIYNRFRAEHPIMMENNFSVICSIDKDLLQVPGHHYNWVRDETTEQTYISGLRCFYEQCLSGDRTDDILGLKGIGAVKAKRALAGAHTEAEMFQITRNMWNNDKGLLQAGQLLWVRRRDGELWEFPFSTHDTIQRSQSLNTTPRGPVPCLEHGSLETNGVPEHGSEQVGILTDDSQPWTS